MAYPLTGSSLSAHTKTNVPGKEFEINPTRVSGSIPLPGYSRNVNIKKKRSIPPISLTNPTRQTEFGLEQEAVVIGDSWGVF
jgi:hypothetical protein